MIETEFWVHFLIYLLIPKKDYVVCDMLYL